VLQQQTTKRGEAEIKAVELPLAAAAGSSSNLELFKTRLINSKRQY
jgi:hypothetical protein